MKAIISTTYDDKYLWYLPLTTWLWNKLGVGVICFAPKYIYFEEGQEGLDVAKRISLVEETLNKNNLKCTLHKFDAPEHKEATYAQCSRLYGACLDLLEDEVLITGDIDMAMLKIPEYTSGAFNIIGSDLTPPKQYPICYLMATVKEWRDAFGLNGKPYQECLDELLSGIESEHFRGNYWCKDQDEAHNRISKVTRLEISRAREGTQFASKRYDRDDAYILDRLSPDTIDFHLLRPGYEDKNFQIILTILQYHYPQEDFGWLIAYNEEYKKLL